MQIQLQALADLPSSTESPAGVIILYDAASAGKLFDLLPAGVFLGVPEGHKRIQAETCCTALALIMFCLSAVLTSDTAHSTSA